MTSVSTVRMNIWRSPHSKASAAWTIILVSASSWLRGTNLAVSFWGGTLSICFLFVITNCLPSLTTSYITCSDMKLNSSSLLSRLRRKYCQLLGRGSEAVTHLIFFLLSSSSVFGSNPIPGQVDIDIRVVIQYKEWRLLSCILEMTYYLMDLKFLQGQAHRYNWGDSYSVKSASCSRGVSKSTLLKRSFPLLKGAGWWARVPCLQNSSKSPSRVWHAM